MTLSIAVINGPNLNLLGTREPEVYGTTTLADVEQTLQTMANDKANLTFFQSNHEGELVDYIQANKDKLDAIIINPAAYTHTSVALRDCLASVKTIPVVEVHISQPYQREMFRQVNYISAVCTASISGFGVCGYAMALSWLLNKLA